MFDVVALWHSYGGPLTGFGGFLGGWYGRVARTHALERRDRLDAGAQALQFAAILEAREHQLSARLDDLQRHNWALLDQVQDVYAEAIAVRLVVHDLDAIAGKPLRQFRPLPPYPFPAEASQPVTNPVSEAN